LTLTEREEISRWLGQGATFRAIAEVLGRAPSTISREVNANGGQVHYRAWRAERRAEAAARRPKAAKLAVNHRLRGIVEAMLEDRCSPQQIARRLRVDHPDDPEMWVSHETIYQSLFIQGRGALRKELASALRTGRTVRRPRASRAGERRGKLRDMVMISERPAEIEDRAVPGHWEGDLLMGANGTSAIATLVERSTRYLQLVELRRGRDAATVRDALTASVKTLPAQLWRSLTWDQGKEMAEHGTFTIDTGIAVYFCDPRSPWQRGSNENTKRTAPPVLPQRHQPPGLHPIRPRRRRRATQPAPGVPPVLRTPTVRG
jgi:IS30 family transposase